MKPWPFLAIPACGLRGDCAAIPDVRSGGICPPTAQYAMREARHLAGNVLAAIAGKAPRPFSHRNLGVFVPLGRFSAAAEVPGFKVSGFLPGGCIARITCISFRGWRGR